MLIKIEDLRKGDEILVGRGGLKYYKLLRDPKLRKGETDRYSSVKCSTRADISTYTSTYGANTYTRTYKRWVCSPFEHNAEKYVDLNYGDIWLVKKGDE